MRLSPADWAALYARMSVLVRQSFLAPRVRESLPTSVRDRGEVFFVAPVDPTFADFFMALAMRFLLRGPPAYRFLRATALPALAGFMPADL